VLACLAVLHFRMEDTTYLRLAAPFLLWPATAWAAGTRFGAWLAGMSKYSFFLFLGHAPILMLTWILYGRYGSAIPYPVYWVMAPLVVSAILLVVYQLAIATIPRVFTAMIGASTRHGAGARPAAARDQQRAATLAHTTIKI
jgi:succinoglycan biosynthesis protein ExoH